MPKVSVLIPAYKSKFLRQMLDSLVSQTYSNIEIIVVDDDSPNNLRQIVDEIEDIRIKYHRNPINIGGENLVSNWNHVLEYATGDLTVLASDDDIYHPEFISKLVDLSMRYPDVNVFHCRVGVIDENNDPIYWGPSIAEYETDIDFIYQRAINRRTQVISDFMFRTDALRSIGGFVNFPKAWYSDEMTVYLMAKGHGVVCAQETLFYWRSSRDNISSLTSDVLLKADASNSYLRSMNELLSSLISTNDKDKFLLTRLKDNIRAATVRQLIYDLSKSPFNVSRKVLSKYGNLFISKDYALLSVGKFRNLLKL